MGDCNLGSSHTGQSGARVIIERRYLWIGVCPPGDRTAIIRRGTAEVALPFCHFPETQIDNWAKNELILCDAQT